MRTGASALTIAARKAGLGNILPTMYSRPTAFRDITSGNNGAYRAVAGYDQDTGLGTPNWNLQANALVGTAIK